MKNKSARLSAMVVTAATTVALLAGCATAPSSGDSTDSERVSVGFSLKTQDAPYFVALGEAIKRYGEDLGWDVTVLDAGNDVQQEASNLETFVSQRKDVIFIDPVEPEAALPSIALAADSEIPVIAVDNAAAEGARIVTNVYANNPENARLVGLAYAEANNDPIEAVILSGSKVDLGSYQRRVGLLAGVIEYRTQKSAEVALADAVALEQALKDNGSASYAEAQLKLVAQGFGDWSEEGGLQAMEDLITANPNVTTVFGENDNMLFGAMTALQNAGKSDIDMVAAADGAAKALSLIAAGEYFATGLNSPDLIAETAVAIAAQILAGKKSADEFDFVTLTEPVAITKKNVEQYMDRGF
ncbi:substrate-binding domain-containing protein [Microbacterium keratanolyticum]